MITPDNNDGMIDTIEVVNICVNIIWLYDIILEYLIVPQFHSHGNFDRPIPKSLQAEQNGTDASPKRARSM